jgi:hypothetical protein
MYNRVCASAVGPFNRSLNLPRATDRLDRDKGRRKGEKRRWLAKVSVG